MLSAIMLNDVAQATARLGNNATQPQPFVQVDWMLDSYEHLELLFTTDLFCVTISVIRNFNEQKSSIKISKVEAI